MNLYRRIRSGWPKPLTIFICLWSSTACQTEAETIVTKSSPSAIHLSYHVGPLDITDVDVTRSGATETRSAVLLQDAQPRHELYGHPALPYVECSVLLPRGTTVESVSLTELHNSRPLALKHRLTFVRQPFADYNMSDPVEAAAWAENNSESQAIYRDTECYPKSRVEYKERNFRGYTLLDLKFTPLRYYPVRNALYLDGSMHFRIDLTDALIPEAAYAYRGLSNDQKIVERIVLNPAAVELYNDTKQPEVGFTAVGISAESAHPMNISTQDYYVIITSDPFADAFEPLRNFHTIDSNHVARVVTTEDIETLYANTNQYLNIASYIQDVLYSNGVEYILLGGDTHIVPGYATGWDFSSDMKFSGGQIPVGRFCFDDLMQLSNCIAKAMTPLPNGADRAALLANHDEAGPTIFDYASFFEPYMPVTLDTNFVIYGFNPEALVATMDTHTIIWGRGHGTYLDPFTEPLDNTNICPVGVNFGCGGAYFDGAGDHQSEKYQTAACGNAAYLGAVDLVRWNSFDKCFLQSYFVDGTATPRVGDMLMIAWNTASRLYTLLGDPKYQIVSDQWASLPRISLPGYHSTSRSYQMDGGSGHIDDVVFRVVSHNNCGWLITNVVCDCVISNTLSFSCLATNTTVDTHLSFHDVTNVPAGTYEVFYDIYDTSNSLALSTKKVTLFFDDKNILTSDDFVVNGTTNKLPAGTYYLADDLVINEGETTLMQPGVSLVSRAFSEKIQVNAGSRLIAAGTVTNAIEVGVNGGLQITIYGDELVEQAASFRYCAFACPITGVDEPTVDFENCTFLLPWDPLFPNRINGIMKNCLLTNRGMGAFGPPGDLSGFDISYSVIVPTNDMFAATTDYHLHGVELAWGNDLVGLGGTDLVPGLLSTCINAGDPEDSPDPDGTVRDIGAFHHDLSAALRVPDDFPNIQSALDAAATSAVDTAIIVASGTYNECVTISNQANNVRLMGESGSNRAVLAMAANPRNLVAFKGNAVIENFIFRNIGIAQTGRVVCATNDNLTLGFRNCRFEGCTSNSDVILASAPAYGMGVMMYLWDTTFVSNCNNTALLHLDEGFKGNALSFHSWLIDTHFVDNTDNGALIFFSAPGEYIYARELVFSNNTNAATLRVDTNASLTVCNGLFTENTGDILAEGAGQLELVNFTMVSNSCEVAARNSAVISIANSIVWNNDMSLTQTDAGIIQIDYTDTDIAPLHPGVGNLSTNPCFVPKDKRFHLQFWSPCLDAGSTNCTYANEPEPNGSRINLGYHGNTPDATVWSDYIPMGDIAFTEARRFQFSAPTVSGHCYYVEFTPSLDQGWTLIKEVTATNSLLEESHTPDTDTGFYRLRCIRP